MIIELVLSDQCGGRCFPRWIGLSVAASRCAHVVAPEGAPYTTQSRKRKLAASNPSLRLVSRGRQIEMLGQMDGWSRASTRYSDVQNNAQCVDVMQLVGQPRLIDVMDYRIVYVFIRYTKTKT